MEKKLYPFKFIPVASRRPWGGHAIVNELGKDFVECGEDGNEVRIGADELIGESWEIADMGIEDSVVAEGWLAGNTIGDIMETDLERVVGEDVPEYTAMLLNDEYNDFWEKDSRTYVVYFSKLKWCK